MILRRLAALSTAMLLLRLNVVAVDVACAEHSTGTSATAERMGSHDHAVTMPAGKDDTRKDASDSCELPVRSDCCQALASCSVTIGSGIEIQSDWLPLDVAGHLALGAHRPASRTDAPEPPPPKA